MDFRAIIEQHLATGAESRSAPSRFSVSRVEGLGLLRVADDLSIQGFAEKPKDPAVIPACAQPGDRVHAEEQSGEKRCLASMASTSSTATPSPRPRELDDGLRPGVIRASSRRRRCSPTSSRLLGGHGREGLLRANLALAQPLPPSTSSTDDAVYSHYEYLPASKLTSARSTTWWSPTAAS